MERRNIYKCLHAKILCHGSVYIEKENVSTIVYIISLSKESTEVNSLTFKFLL